MQQKTVGFWVSWVGITVAAGLYIYALWSAIGNIILLPQSAAGFGLTVSPYGWFWLILQLVLPVLVAALAVLIGRKRPLPLRVLVLFSGIALVSVFSIDMANSIPITSYFG